MCAITHVDFGAAGLHAACSSNNDQWPAHCSASLLLWHSDLKRTKKLDSGRRIATMQCDVRTSTP
jgi:hypothetical protein